MALPASAVRWEITELVAVTSARVQQGGWRDWLLWIQACAGHQPGKQANQPVIDMLTAGGGDFLTFALVTARKNKPARCPCAHRLAARATEQIDHEL
ncbi:hypothetical protein AB0D83_35915 [Streptomyces decoyicus]|uniref:hypothetical protein n=1 Tax=Streptomyces decoyicus TaxID=249567 RepID=UPI003409B46E